MMTRWRYINFISVSIAFCGTFFVILYIILQTKSQPNIKNNLNLENIQYILSQTNLKKFDDEYVEEIIEKTRHKIRHDVSNYNFSDSGVKRLEDLVMEYGGKPVRSAIVSTFRSGSTFFGEILNAVPGNYYNFEPLSYYNGPKQIRNRTDVVKAIKHLKNIFKCNLIDVPEYFEFYTKLCDGIWKYIMSLWDHCKDNNFICTDPEFTSRVCKLYPFQSMKINHLRLKYTGQLLEDEKLSLKIVLLVRDPRGVMNSRLKLPFCQQEIECISPEVLCADMVRDYHAANELMEKYPNRIMVLRYEELSLKPLDTVGKVLQFLKLSMSSSVLEFLRTHTNFAQKLPEYPRNVLTTVRVSKDNVFKWKYGLDFDYVHDVQMVCKDAMELWGYKIVHNATQLVSQEFYPLKPYGIRRRHDYQ